MRSCRTTWRAAAVAMAALAVVWNAAPASGVGDGKAGERDAYVESLLKRGASFERRGEPRRAAAAYRAALRREPGLERAYERLLAIHDRIGPPSSAAQRKRLARQFEDGVYLRQSEHYLIVYDGRHHWVDTRAKLMEQARDNFYRRLRAAGFRPLPLAERLEVVLFSDHRDFRAYASARDHGPGEWSAGYYASGDNRVVMFNFHTSPQLARLVDEIERLRGDVENLKALSRIKPTHRRRLSNVRRELGRVQQRYHTIAAWGNIRQTLHEAAHQLAYNSGIQRRDLQYPLWFSEGLATAFETSHPAAPFGPGVVNGARLRGLFEARREGEVMPLGRMVALTRPADEENPRNAAYSQAWALFHYLFVERTGDLRRYVAHMAGQPAGRRSPAEHLADFERCFGPIDKVEAGWRDYVRKMLR